MPVIAVKCNECYKFPFQKKKEVISLLVPSGSTVMRGRNKFHDLLPLSACSIETIVLLLSAIRHFATQGDQLQFSTVQLQQISNFIISSSVKNSITRIPGSIPSQCTPVPRTLLLSIIYPPHSIHHQSRSSHKDSSIHFSRPFVGFSPGITMERSNS